MYGLADRGVVEVTLLGQNVNTYGRDLTVPGSFLRSTVTGAAPHHLLGVLDAA